MSTADVGPPPAEDEQSGKAASVRPGAGTVTVQARIDAEFARELLESDAPVLGLSSVSELVREGLRLLHKQAREHVMAGTYDEFYGGAAAPVSEVMAALWADEG
jgi:hypothetical protein